MFLASNEHETTTDIYVDVDDIKHRSRFREYLDDSSLDGDDDCGGDTPFQFFCNH